MKKLSDHITLGTTMCDNWRKCSVCGKKIKKEKMVWLYAGTSMGFELVMHPGCVDVLIDNLKKIQSKPPRNSMSTAQGSVS